ncbi:MAG: response regulator [Ruminiclostridium sp.]|nr:response regulator [Ruminiclostridium sp.]
MKRNKLGLTLPLATTFILMVLVIAYTSNLFYRISVTSIYESGEDKLDGVSAGLGNYLDTARSVLWITGDTVDFMMANNEPMDKILAYIVEETQRHKSQFDVHYTGLYGYIGGWYLDGLNWMPPEDYDPTQRDWYMLAKAGAGELVIVPPYVDAQTGSVIISVCRLLSDGESVISLDVYTDQIQSVINETDIQGKGYGFIVNRDGAIVAHKDSSFNGKMCTEMDGGADLLEKLKNAGSSSFETVLDGKKCTVFSDIIMGQWYVAIAVGNDELFTEMYSQLAVNVAIYTAVFLLIALFYYIAYRNEQKIGRETEALKIREQQKAYETELLRLEKSAADAANKAKGDFLAQMSHEIRTPINAILGMNEMILRESEDAEILEYSENISTAGKTLLSLINSILDFSKIEDGKMEIIPVKYDTASLINNLVHSVSGRAKDKGLEFVVRADPKLPRMMYGDDVRITQIIMNLLTNAVKYTERGKITFTISSRSRTDSEIIIAVSVKDTGIGIRNEDIDKMFESFSRLDETRNRNIEGTGLGMAIVTKLLALMNSKLKVESVYGVGSVFSFELEQGITDATPIGETLERRADPVNRREKEKKRYPNAKVLVTDDNDMNLKVAKNLLKLFGITADLASSGEEAISLMRRKNYNILFLDHMMPKMDGIETLKRLKEQELIPPETTVIALTANAVMGAKEAYMEAGFDDYLSKPIEIDHLDEKLEKYLPKGLAVHTAAQPEKSAAAVKPAEPEPEKPVEPEKPSGTEIIEFAPAEDGEVMEFAPAEEEGGAPTSDEELLRRLDEAGLSAQSGLSYCAGDIEFYREMLTDYAETAENRLSELSSALANNDIANYRILVHSLKSVSKTVGAVNVSDLAKSLEDAAKNNDTEQITAHNGELNELLTDTAAKIKKLVK